MILKSIAPPITVRIRRALVGDVDADLSGRGCAARNGSLADGTARTHDRPRSRYYWSGGALPVIVTLIGWLTLIKAVVLVALPSNKLVALYGGVSPTHILISGALTLLLGIYLTVSGFRSSLEKSKY
jgi:hypothetical protein